MTKEKVFDLLEKFKGKRIGVIGDMMLDKFIWGVTERISPEAPVPVVTVDHETYMPGGAGNTANNIAGLGGQVFAVGVIGSGQGGKQLLLEFKKEQVSTDGILLDDKRPTIKKTRLIANNQHVVRIDREDKNDISRPQQDKVLNYIRANIDTWDCVVVSDYSKGFLTEYLAGEIVKLCKEKNKIIIVDAKPNHMAFYKGATLITPNYKEAKEITQEETVERMGIKLMEDFDCNVLLTQGSNGMTLFTKEFVEYYEADAREVFDVSGAGDTVVAVTALGMSSGVGLKEAIEMANYAAGIVVSKVGTASLTPEDFKRYFKRDEQN